MTTSGTWSLPPRLGEYRLIRPLGHGGMGHVWLAHDELLDRAARSRCSTRRSRDGSHERLQRKRGPARLSHPNVLGITASASSGARRLVEELVRSGVSLVDKPYRGDESRARARIARCLARRIVEAC